MRAGRRYAVDSRHVARVVPCRDITPISAQLMLASLEGLPALLVEPQCLLGPGPTPADPIDPAALPQSPAIAVVIGKRGVLQCGFAADHADFFGSQPTDHVVSAQQMNDVLESL